MYYVPRYAKRALPLMDGMPAQEGAGHFVVQTKEEKDSVAKYRQLARRLGSLAGEISSDRVRSVDCSGVRPARSILSLCDALSVSSALETLDVSDTGLAAAQMEPLTLALRGSNLTVRPPRGAGLSISDDARTAVRNTVAQLETATCLLYAGIIAVLNLNLAVVLCKLMCRCSFVQTMLSIPRVSADFGLQFDRHVLYDLMYSRVVARIFVWSARSRSACCEVLRVGRNCLYSEGAVCLAELLRTTPLQDLDAPENALGHEGAAVPRATYLVLCRISCFDEIT